MKIGFVGLGKLGLPCAVSMAMEHDVMGYDINPDNMNKDPKPYIECGVKTDERFNDYLAKSSIKFGELEEVVEHSDVIFVAVQTPHHKMYEGITRVPDERVDFDYTYLEECISKLSKLVKKDTVITVISTVLPGTMTERIKPLLNDHMKLCYNPYFIAMGTTMNDFFNPDMILLGYEKDQKDAAQKVKDVYKFVLDRFLLGSRPEIRDMSIESAEATKVFYNTYITMKVVFGNIVAECCDKILGADCDEIMDALKSAKGRIISEKYLTPGMGDSGGCHPRDNIGLSNFAQKHNLSFDLFDALMGAREAQAERYANMLIDYSKERGLPVCILGYAYKPNINLTVGSHALLVRNIMEEIDLELVKDRLTKRECSYAMLDRYIDGEYSIDAPHVFLIGINHDYMNSYKFPSGSLVLDPFRIVKDQEGVEVMRLGSAESVH
jgi:UDPglucose 6-dehydrogenase